MFEKRLKDNISINRKISRKTEKVISKKINELSLTDLTNLLKIEIGEQFCLNLLIEKINSEGINFDLSVENKDHKKIKELLKEIILLNHNNWDINPKAHKVFKNIVLIKNSEIEIPENQIERFTNYTPDEFIWNEKTISEFKAFMNDNRMGVFCAYSMLMNRKRRILNGGKFQLILKKQNIEINSLKEFEEKVLKTVKINKELSELLKELKN